MKDLMTRSLNKLFLAISFIALIGFVDATRVESRGEVEQVDAATAIANVCSALLEGCGRSPALCGLTDNPESTKIIDLYNEAVGDIKALNLESSPNDLALAKGIIRAALITAVARNLSVQAGLEQIEAMCNEDIDAL